MYYRGEDKLFRRKDYKNIIELNTAIKIVAVTLQATKNYADRICIKGNVVDRISDLNTPISSEYFEQDDVTLIYIKGHLDNKRKIINEVAEEFKEHKDININLIHIMQVPDLDNIENVKVTYGYVSYTFEEYLNYAKEWLNNEDDNE